MKKCKYCGAQLPSEANFCHQCAKSLLEPQTPAPPKRINKQPFFAAAALVMILAAVLIWPKGDVPPKADPSPASVSGSIADETPEPAPEPTPEPTSEAENIFTAENAALEYKAGEDVYSIVVCHSRVPQASDVGEYELTHEIAPGQRFYSSVLLYAFKDGKFAPSEFLALTESINIVTTPLDGSMPLEYGDCMCSDSHPGAVSCSGYFFDDLSYSNAIDWEIKMKNGDILRLRQEVHVATVEVAEFHFEDYPMNSIEELDELLEWIYANVDESTEVKLFLPPVVYEGGIDFSRRGINLYGSHDSLTDTGTTFTGPVKVSAFGPALSEFCGIRFIGDGRGTGLQLGCALVVQDCLFQNWGTGVYVGNRGWLINWSNRFVENDVGMEINNTSGSQIVNTDFMGCTFEGNALAFRLSSCFFSDSVNFIECIFRGNGTFSENLTTNNIDTSMSTFE